MRQQMQNTVGTGKISKKSKSLKNIRETVENQESKIIFHTFFITIS